MTRVPSWWVLLVALLLAALASAANATTRDYVVLQAGADLDSLAGAAADTIPQPARDGTSGGRHGGLSMQGYRKLVIVVSSDTLSRPVAGQPDSVSYVSADSLAGLNIQRSVDGLHGWTTISAVGAAIDTMCMCSIARRSVSENLDENSPGNMMVVTTPPLAAWIGQPMQGYYRVIITNIDRPRFGGGGTTTSKARLDRVRVVAAGYTD